MKIQVLRDQVVNQIAAGEVVERPVSVVRELVDNSIDAGATDLAIFVEQGGRSLIRIIDNGSGMGRDDALLCFERHATSKIREAQDLLQVKSLGFRGEALSSIAAVARVNLRTREKGTASGTEITIEGGKVLGVSEVACPEGTEISVRNLFFSVPARKKFLKQPATELLRIRQWIEQSSLGHPEVRYRLFSEGQESLNLPRRDSVLARAKDLLHGSTVEFAGEASGYKLLGTVAHPAHAQFDAGGLVILVNGRLVSDRMIMRAVRDGFSSTLKAREYPVGVVAIELPSADVDVNVHPQKSEVRFRDGQKIFGLILSTIKSAVGGFSSPAPRDYFEQPVSNWSQSLRSTAVRETGAPYASPIQGEQSGLGFSASPGPGFKFSELRLIGQALGCYLFCEYAGQVYVVDMHAAHERFNFNLIRNRYQSGNVPSQQLAIPETIELSELGAKQVLAAADTLHKFGFELEGFGKDSVIVRAAPPMVSSQALKDLIRDLASIPEEAAAEGGINFVIDQVASRIACHASVRSGRWLEREEVYALFESLDQSEFSTACPHGRPVIVSFSAEEIEQWFGRDK